MKMGAVTMKIDTGCQNRLFSDGPEKSERWK